MASHRPPLLDAPPHSDRLTEYDHQHGPTYLFLLDHSAAGAPWRDAMAQLIGPAAAHDPERAKRIYDAHLARARWMAEVGWQFFLRNDA